MLNIYRSNELYKQLAVWLCCAAESPAVDYYLCQHCETYIVAWHELSEGLSAVKKFSSQEIFQADQVQVAFRKLTPDQRCVILMKIVNRLSNQEVANALAKSASAIQAIQHRALIILGHLLFLESDIQVA